MATSLGARAKGAFLIACVFFGFAMPAAAQVTLPEEYNKTVKSAEAVGALGPNLFGDDTSLYTGATTFTATDVSLRGNNALPVAVGRRFVVQSRDASERSALLTRVQQAGMAYAIFSLTNLSAVLDALDMVDPTTYMIYIPEAKAPGQ